MRYALKLHVVSQTPQSMRALENLKRVCESELKGQYGLKVTDVLKESQLPEEDEISATPPPSKVAGDMSDRQRVSLGLSLVPGKRNGGPVRRRGAPRIQRGVTGWGSRSTQT